MNIAIVSFYAPRPEHAFFQDYTPFLALLRESCARYGVPHRVLTDDPDIAEDGYVVSLPRSLMRAFVAAQFAWLSDPANADTPTLFVGADCVLGKSPSAFAEQCGDHDVLITVSDAFADCRMNTGAIYIPRPARMAPIWCEALKHVGEDWGTDQTAIYLAICKAAVQRGLRVAEVPVDPWNLAPSTPSEDCSRGVVLHFRGPRKRWMIDYCHKHLGLGQGIQVLAAPNVDFEGMLANVRASLGLGLLSLKFREAHDGHAVIVGGGASAANYLTEIAWRKTCGQTLFALNGVARWLQANGIAPDYGVVLDPRPNNARFILGGDVHWLLASQCHPDVFEAARGEQQTLWHFAAEGIETVVPPGETIVGGGLTVGLSAMGVAYALGYRQMHLYGYDSSDLEDRAHSYAQDETEVERKRVEVWHAGRKFRCQAAMYAQAEAFPRWVETLTDAGAEISVHGDGLLPSIAHEMSSTAAQQESVPNEHTV